MYFDRRLGLATGVAAAGSGLGQLVFSPIFHHAEQELGLQGTLYLLAGLLTSGAVAGYLFQPLQQEQREEETDKNGNDNKAFSWEPSDLADYKDNTEVGEEQTEKGLKTLTVLETLKSPRIMIVMASHLLMHFGN